MPVGDTYEAKFFCDSTDQLSVNVLNFQVTAIDGVEPTDQVAADQLSAIAAPVYIALLSAGARYYGLSWQKVAPAPPRPPVFSLVGRATGTVAGDLMPRQTSGLVTLRTLTAGRAGRGRKYLPFPGEADNAATGVPTAGYLTRLDAWRVAVIATLDLNPSGTDNFFVTPVIRGGVPTTNKVVVSSVSRSAWATQRRRGSFGRPNILPF